jgi:hypothetical protein
VLSQRTQKLYVCWYVSQRILIIDSNNNKHSNDDDDDDDDDNNNSNNNRLPLIILVLRFKQNLVQFSKQQTK